MLWSALLIFRLRTPSCLVIFVRQRRPGAPVLAFVSPQAADSSSVGSSLVNTASSRVRARAERVL
jgi:hypothetical protein